MSASHRPKTIDTEHAEYIFKISLDSIYMEHRDKGISLARFCKLVKRNCAFLLDGPPPRIAQRRPKPKSSRYTSR